MKIDGNIVIDAKINPDGMQRGISEIKDSMTKLGGIVKGIGKAVITAFTIKQIMQFDKECLELRSDLAEVQNVVDVIFPSMTRQVDDFAETAADSFGFSETMAKKYVGTFGAMSESFGYSKSAAYDMATALTGLVGDVTNLYNLSQEEAYTKLKSVFTGETESFKEPDVIMTQSALDQYALANGFGGTTNKITEQEKAALRLQFVQNQLSAAGDDFVRISDSQANQIRIFQLGLQPLKATVGQGLINLFTPIIKAINVFLERLSTATTAFKNFTEAVIGKKSVNSGAVQAAGKMAEVQAGYEGAVDGTKDLADGVRDTGKRVKKSLAPSDNLIQIQRDAEEGSENTGDSSIMSPGLSPGEQQTESLFLKDIMETLEAIRRRLIKIGGVFQSGF